MKLVRLTMGWVSLFGSVAFVAAVVLSAGGEGTFGHTNRVPLALGGALGFGIGLLAMLIDMNLRKGFSEAERGMWRARLMWLGPLAAPWYFLGSSMITHPPDEK